MLYSSKNVMGENKQQLGFTLIELIFVLALMGAFVTCFVIKPFRSRDDAVYGTKVILSEAVFLARLYAMGSDDAITLDLVSRSDYDSLDEFVDLEIKKGPWMTKRSKRLDSRISNCSFVNFPEICKSSDRPQNSFKAGEIPQNQVIFKEKFFTPFQLKFSLEGKEWFIAVDANAQTHIYAQE
ncbi:MAG: type II secretion system GspH family protein [Puniceicoccales bacterium]|nr:type II secretion system GspH family protein [Puniceicoccales bacterium]